MLKYVALFGLLVMLVGGGIFGYAYYLGESHHGFFDEGHRLKAKGDQAGADAAYRRAHATRDEATTFAVIGLVVGGVGGVLALPIGLGLLLVRLFAPKVSYRSIDEVIAANTTADKLHPGERVLNSAFVLRQPYSPGDRTHVSEKLVRVINVVKPRWSEHAVVLTTERLIVIGVATSLLAGFRYRVVFDEEYPTVEIIDCTTDQHWKGKDIILHFPKAFPMLLRRIEYGKTCAGQQAFWQEVPQRFAKPPVIAVARA